MRRGSVLRITAVGIVVGIVTSLIAVLVPWLPTSASEEMDRIEFTFWFTTAICVGIFALVAGVILYSVAKFRAQPDDDTDGAPIHGHTGLEIVWTAVPAILVTAISIVSAIVLARNDDAGANPLRVSVTAQQFAWRFEYPDEGKLRSPRLVLPVGRAVKLTLRSLDVIHAFWVPEFGQKSDAVPGIETTLVITPKRLGTFSVICTELCGLGHALMRAQAQVVSEADYAKWTKEQRAAAGGGAGGDEGAALFASQGCGGCHTFGPAGTDAEVGPSLNDLAASAERAGRPVDEFARESIADPRAVLAEGYPAGVMPETFGQSLSDDELDALVQYLVGGKKKSE